MRLGLAQEGELWVLTHAVYSLRESPKLWSDLRDCQLLGLKLVVDGEELQLQRGRWDPNWWKIRTSDEAVVGGLLTYVDDFLLAGSKEVIAALAKAIRPFGRPRLSLSQRLGVDILVQGTGFLLGQQAYAEELLRLNDVKPAGGTR